MVTKVFALAGLRESENSAAVASSLMESVEVVSMICSSGTRHRFMLRSAAERFCSRRSARALASFCRAAAPLPPLDTACSSSDLLPTPCPFRVPHTSGCPGYQGKACGGIIITYF